MTTKRKCKECGAVGPWGVYLIWDNDRPHVNDWIERNRKRGWKWWQCPKCDEAQENT
jgi:hypothetical protein